MFCFFARSIILGKSDNYRQATWTGLACNPGDPSADKDPFKAENPKITFKFNFDILIPSFRRRDVQSNADIHCHADMRKFE